jgi:hypothetical protein
MENGERPVGPTLAKKIAQALNISHKIFKNN